MRPDGNPLVGPIKGLRNFWVACGVMAGFSQGGGVGLALSRWMVDGDPGADVWGMDVARYGDWTTLAYTNAKVRENYSRRFSIRFPNEELPAARPLRTTPIYEALEAEHAVFGDYCALEHPLWFAPTAQEALDQVSFRRSNSHRTRRRGVPRGARRGRPAGDLELRQVRGARAGRRASGSRSVMANRVPAVGRIALTPDAERARQADRRFHHVPPGRGPLLPDRHLRGGDLLHALVRAAPAAERRLRAAVRHGIHRACRSRVRGRATCCRAWCATTCRRAAFPFMSFRRMEVGMVPGFVGRVSFTGELGYEIWVTTRLSAGAL